jgi:hypothetical protein
MATTFDARRRSMLDEVGEFRRALEGATCGSVLAQAYERHGELATPVTVLFLEFAAHRWALFGIDGGDFHWRETTAPDVIAPGSNGDSDSLIELATHLGIRGQRIERVSFHRETSAAGQGGRVSVELESGAVLLLVNANDQSHVGFASPSARSSHG